MAKLEHQAGFGVVAIALVILVVAVASYIGWRVWDANQSSQTSNNQSSSNTSQGNNNTTQGDYLDIKELGVKLPLSDGIKDLIYSAKKNDDGSYALHFSTTSIVASDVTCSPEADPLGIYSAYTSEQQKDPIATALVPNLAVHVNGYYIYYAHVQYACGSDATGKLLSTAIPELLTAMQKAQ